MTQHDDSDIPDDKLLTMPEANLQSRGALVRLWAVRAQEKQREDQVAQRNWTVMQRRQKALEGSDEAQELALHRRESELLERIAESERELRREAEELDRRTIRLADGRAFTSMATNTATSRAGS